MSDLLVGEVVQLREQLAAMRARAEKAEASAQHAREWYAVRLERLSEFIRDEIPEPQKTRFFAILANGTADHMEPPTYASQMNTLRSEKEKAEAACAEMREALAPFFCETCEGKKTFIFECQGCLTGEGECTCDKQQPEPCPQCRAIPAVSKIYDDREHALSTDCGRGWLSPEKAQRLREALELIADGRWNVGKINDVDVHTYARLRLKALEETK